MDAYTGQIILFAGDYVPQGWVPCDGRMLNPQQYAALFSLIGATYGGNGLTTFAVPDLRGRLPIGQGQGKDNSQNKLSMRTVGQSFGTETVTLAESEMPPHRHQLTALNATATTRDPMQNLLAKPVHTLGTSKDMAYITPPTPPVTAALAPDTLSSAGGGQAHENRMPTQALTYLMCLNGLYPVHP